MSATWNAHMQMLDNLRAGGASGGSPAWQNHMAQYNALSPAQPAAAPAPAVAPAPIVPASLYPGMSPDMANHYAMLMDPQNSWGNGTYGAGYSFRPGDALGGEFGMGSYGGGPHADLSQSLGSLGLGSLGLSGANIPGWAGGLLGGVAGTALAGPIGGIIGAYGGRSLAGLLGDYFGGDGMASGAELAGLGAHANQNAENMAGAGFGDGRGL